MIVFEKWTRTKNLAENLTDPDAGVTTEEEKVELKIILHFKFMSLNNYKGMKRTVNIDSVFTLFFVSVVYFIRTK